MNIRRLVARTRQDGVDLWLDNGRLRYRARRGVMTARLKADLKARRSEIIDYLSSENQSITNEPKAAKISFPLSLAQQRFWLMQNMEPGNPAYNVPLYTRVRGDLNVAALEQSLDELLARHEVLRSIYLADGGELQQRITPRKQFMLPVIDCGTTGRQLSEADIRQIAGEELRKPFDLSRGPMFRAQILRLNPADHLLLLTTHHIAVDGWSLRLLRSEIEQLYAAYRQSHTPVLHAIPVHYSDYVDWERDSIESSGVQRQLGYWKNALEGLSPVFLPPATSARNQHQAGKGASIELELPADLAEQLVEFSRRSGVTLFMTLLTALTVLLKWYAQQDDLCVATAVSNRRIPGSENLVGSFANTLLLRTDLSGNPDFLALLQRVREIAVEAYANQDVPYDWLVRELSGIPDGETRSLYQVMFVLHEGERQLQLGGLDCQELTVETGAARDDLTLVADNNGSRITFHYRADLFEEWLITRMTRHYKTLLKEIVRDPGQHLSQLTRLTEKERHQVIAEWNDSGQEYDCSIGIQELFEKQVEHVPDAIAVIYEHEELKYGELNSRANQLAHYLQSLGVGPNVLVGLCMERSLEMVVGLLGIVKAGGTYVPLSPTYPQQRLAFMLADAEVQVLLTHSVLLKLLPEVNGKVICLDRDWPAILGYRFNNAVNTATAKDIAYVIYTSGSTGNPKGVAISHSSIGSYCQLMRDCWPVVSSDRVLQLASLSFDVSLAEILIPLCCGGSTVLSPDDILEPIRLSKLLSDHKITRVNFSPAYWRQWIQTLSDQEDQFDLSELRLVIVGGDVVPADCVRMWNRLAMSRRVDLVNMYGPTEATVTTTAYRVTGDQKSNNVPIGRPLPGRSVYILDARGSPLPVGVAGELHIGGDCLAKGYLNRPELTAEKFIPDPFSDDSKGRLYKTGDLARFLADGNIEFLGRIDFQLKIRGFRIEPGEIEVVLVQHPSVKDAVVIALEDNPGEKRLIAYIIFEPNNKTSASELRRFLKVKLPEYMVPSAFVELEALPVSTNGKVDRKALPIPDHTRPELHTIFVASRTSVEERLAALWGDILNLDEIGVNDNFFELGGHSLTATQVISRVRDVFKLELPLKDIFDSPTLGDLANTITQQTSDF